MTSTTSQLDNRQGANIQSIARSFHENGRFLSARGDFAERIAERVYGRSKRIRHRLAVVESRRWRKS